MKAIKGFVWFILRKLKLAGSLQLVLKSTLKEYGWFLSYNTKQSVDCNNAPIPWFTYPAIKFLAPRLTKDLSVFEYGCGNSTIWFADRIGKIISVEHDKEWYTMVLARMPENAKLIFEELQLGGRYCNAVVACNEKFDIIIIDGRDRDNCAKKAINCLSDRGIIVFDNSNFDYYKEGADFIYKSGFKRLDFYGMTPIAAPESCTTIFYRDGNCLGI